MFTSIKKYFVALSIISLSLIGECGAEDFMKPGIPVPESVLSQQDREAPKASDFQDGKCLIFDVMPDGLAPSIPAVKTPLCVRQTGNGPVFKFGSESEVGLSELFSRGAQGGTCFMQFPLVVGSSCQYESVLAAPSGTHVLFKETVVLKALERVKVKAGEYIVFTFQSNGHWRNLTNGGRKPLVRFFRYAPRCKCIVEEYSNGGRNVRYKELSKDWSDPK